MNSPSSGRTKKDKETRERKKERTLYVTERASADDAVIRRSSRCERALMVVGGTPCESRTSLGNQSQPVKVEFFIAKKASTY